MLKKAREFIGGQGGWRGTGSVREDHGGMEKTSDSLRGPETGEGGQGGVERVQEGSESRGGLEKPGRVEESQGGLEMSRVLERAKASGGCGGTGSAKKCHGVLETAREG